MNKLKKLLVWAVALLLPVAVGTMGAVGTIGMSGCTKNTDTTAATPTTSTVSEAGNNITVTDDSITYTEADAGCTVNLSGSGSTVSIQSVLYSGFPIAMSFLASGPPSGIGLYRFTPIDSTSYNFPFYYTESYLGGETYKVDSVHVTLTRASADTVLGSFQLWLSNLSKSQTVSGTISCDAATIY